MSGANFLTISDRISKLLHRGTVLNSPVRGSPRSVPNLCVLSHTVLRSLDSVIRILYIFLICWYCKMTEQLRFLKSQICSFICTKQKKVQNHIYLFVWDPWFFLITKRGKKIV